MTTEFDFKTIEIIEPKADERGKKLIKRRIFVFEKIKKEKIEEEVIKEESLQIIESVKETEEIVSGGDKI